jgi:hypothetical protein
LDQNVVGIATVWLLFYLIMLLNAGAPSKIELLSQALEVAAPH